MPEHDTFYVIRSDSRAGGSFVTVSHEVPAGYEELGSFPDPGVAIDFAQMEVQRLNASGAEVEYVDPPEDLVGTG